MSQVPLSALNFRQASFSLQRLLAQLERDFSSLGLGTAEAFQKFRQEWSLTLIRYRATIREMPKAFRHHPLVKKSLYEIKLFEKELQRFKNRMSENSFPEFRDWSDRLRAKISRVALQVAELEASPLVQKFIRGETVLPDKRILQWRRKLVHITLGLSFLWLFVYSGWPRSVIWGITGPFILWAFSLELIRHLNPRVNRWVFRVFGSIMREGENEKVNAAVFYILSMGIVYFVFPVEVAMLALLFIAVGDPIAGIVGIHWGRHKISSSVSWEGSAACFLVCAGLAALCAGRVFHHTLSGAPLVLFSLLAGLTGAVSEASFKKLDDNLVMPLLSAPILWGLMKVFEILV
ncbi:MAG: hypothetical protein HYS22_01615 [Deltaproteobacteria bacterium]|nr:hypothetical protein [Deltaproteobacteria bacterium]